MFGIDTAVPRAETERTIVVASSVKRSIERGLKLELDRSPTRTEREQALRDWKVDEAAYREGLRLRLAEHSPEVRGVLVSRVRELRRQLAFVPEPTDADLDAWLASHRDVYETPAGLPPPAELRRRLTLAWKLAAQERATNASLDALLAEYRFVDE